MQVFWRVICSEKSLFRIQRYFQWYPMKVKPYWKDSDCWEMECTYKSEASEEAQLMQMCRLISGCDKVWIDRQTTSIEYACYVSLDEIKNGDTAFTVCFVDMKEKRL